MSGNRSELKTWGIILVVGGVIVLCCGLIPVAMPMIGGGLSLLVFGGR